MKYLVAEGSWNIETLQMDAINLYDLIWYIYGYTGKPLKPTGTQLWSIRSLVFENYVGFIFIYLFILRATHKIFSSVPYFFWTAYSHLVFTHFFNALFHETNKVKYAPLH